MEKVNEYQEQQHLSDSKFNEWGEYIGKTNDDVIYMHYDGVLECIQENNPAITSIEAWFFPDMQFDWEMAGQYIGSSTCVTDLCLTLDDGYSIEDLKLFCKGLAHNKSIVWLKVFDCSSIVRNKTYKYSYLLPFFKCNQRLERFETCVCGFPRSLSIAIDASRSISSIEFIPDSEFDWSDSSSLDGLIIQSLIEKPSLRHLNLDGRILSTTACHALCVVLADKTCVVQSLTLTVNVGGEQNVHEDDMKAIISGLSQNESVKCFKIQSDNHKSARFILSRLQCTTLRSLEKLHLEFYDEARIDAESLINNIPQLKCLVLENVDLDVAPGPSLSLQELNFDGTIECNEQLLEFADSLTSTTTLKKLCIKDSSTRTSNVTSVDWCAFLDNISALELEELSLVMKDFGYDALLSISRYLESNQHLKKLKMNNLMTDSGGLDQVVFAILSHPNIEDIRVSAGSDMSGQSVDSLSSMLQIIPQISHVEVTTVGLHQFGVIGSVLSSSSCTLEDLLIYHENDEQDLDPSEEFARINQIVLDALKVNRSLKALRYNYWEVDMTDDETDFMWASFCEILCDKSSIEATYNSNHVLETLVINPLNKMPMELYTLLYLNTNPNKHAVARQKIIRTHVFDNIDFVPSSLPTVLAWVGNDGTLSQLYGIVRNVPNEVRNRNEAKQQCNVQMKMFETSSVTCC